MRHVVSSLELIIKTISKNHSQECVKEFVDSFGAHLKPWQTSVLPQCSIVDAREGLKLVFSDTILINSNLWQLMRID